MLHLIIEKLQVSHLSGFVVGIAIGLAVLITGYTYIYMYTNSILLYYVSTILITVCVGFFGISITGLFQEDQ